MKSKTATIATNEISVRCFVEQVDALFNSSSAVESLQRVGHHGVALNETVTQPPRKKNKRRHQKSTLNTSNGTTTGDEQQQQHQQQQFSDLELVVGLYLLLLNDYKAFATRWNYALLASTFLANNNNNNNNGRDNLVKWFVMKIVTLLVHVTPRERRTWLVDMLDMTSEQASQCSLDEQEIFLHDHDNNDCKQLRTLFDATKFALFKLDTNSNNEALSDSLPLSIYFDGMKLGSTSTVSKSANKSDDNTTTTSTTTMTTASSSSSSFKHVVFVDTARRNLNKLVMSVITDEAIVIEGALSSGKTTLVEYLAHKTNTKLVKYQMDEFMDAKSLIGNYVCSEIPGEFLWKPGPLYKVNKDDNKMHPPIIVLIKLFEK